VIVENTFAVSCMKIQDGTASLAPRPTPMEVDCDEAQRPS